LLVQNVLLPIREYVGFPMVITSGVRDKPIIEAMLDHGFHPSKKTDHAYMDPAVNQFGIGAADFVVQWPNMIYKSTEHKRRMYDVFKWIINNPSIQTSQVIYYTEWGSIHISNYVGYVYSTEFANVIGRHLGRSILISGNGVHYAKYDASRRFDQMFKLF